tara:strand:+ start:1267 stop:2166 length:900 start_codon:yes stop_codon:yes gene_type:complete
LNELRNKTVLITGASGFIGTSLSKFLVKNGNKVYSLGRTPGKYCTEFISADISDDLVGKIPKVDLVFHLAAITDMQVVRENPKKVFDVNVVGTINLLKAISNMNINKFIYFSSVAVYGNTSIIPTPENCKFRPLEFYGYTKYASEFLVENFCSSASINYIILRSYNAYGPNQRENLVLPYMLNSALNGKITVRNGDNTRDFIFINDLVNAIIKSSQLEGNYIFNIGTGVEVSLNNLAREISRQVPNEVEIINSPVSDRPSVFNVSRGAADISSIIKETGWRPEYDIKKGIKALIGNKVY